MKNNSFVYIWINLTNNRKYIGYHKGSKDDGYICSSGNPQFWEDFENVDMAWERKILFEGNQNDCLIEEQRLLKNADLQSNKWYNNARGANIIWTDDVRKKSSKSHKNRWKNVPNEIRQEYAHRLSETSKKWWSSLSEDENEEFRLNVSNGMKNYWNELSEEDKLKKVKKSADGHKGKHYHSEEWKAELSEKLKGNNFGALQSEDNREKKRQLFLSDKNPGKNKSEETRKKISESKKGKAPWNKGQKRKQLTCPYCGKVGGDGTMQRWHFNNCKFKNEIKWEEKIE